MLIGIFLLFISTINSQNVTILRFRENNEANNKTEAFYSGPILTENLNDFSFCFRYNVYFFNDRWGSGMTILKYVVPTLHLFQTSILFQLLINSIFLGERNLAKVMPRYIYNYLRVRIKSNLG